MDDKTPGASAAQTGLSPTAKPLRVSSANAASIPSAGQWIVVRETSAFGWARFGATEAGKVTAKMVVFARRGTCWGKQARLEHVIAAMDSRQEAEKLASDLSGVAGEFLRKKMAADRERSARVKEYEAVAERQAQRVIASAMSAQRAETEGLSPQDASAVGASRDAHPSPEQSS